MILRFKAKEGAQTRYLAINTSKEIYVTSKAEVCAEYESDVIRISSKNFDHIWAELQFCGYDWAESLGVATQVWKAG